jgi:HIP---CoA ligase
VNTRFRGEEAAYVIRNGGARTLFVANGFVDNDYVGILRSADPQLDVLKPDRTIALSGPTGEGQLTWEGFLAGGAVVPVDRADTAINAIGPESLSDIMFTFGTTGHPKGVQLTHGQSLRAHGFYAMLMQFRPGDRYLIIPPFVHTFGYKAGWMACLVHGVTVVPQETFAAEDVMARIQAERISILFGPPTIFQAILDSPLRAHFDLSSIRVTLISATLVPPELLRRVRDELKPDHMFGGYGLTEATSS